MHVALHTYRQLDWLVKPFFLLFKEFWGIPITLFAEEDYSSGEMDFLAIPPEFQKAGEWEITKFSDAITWYLQQISDPRVVLFLADQLVYKPVNTDLVQQALEYMDLRPNIFRVQLGKYGKLKGRRKTDKYRDLEILERSFFQTSLTPAIWDRKRLLQIISPSKNPWEMELDLRKKFIRTGWRSVTISPFPITYANAIMKGKEENLFLTNGLKSRIGNLVKLPVEEIDE